MKRAVITVVAAILLLAVPALFATPITGFNTRPAAGITVATTWLPGADEANIWDILGNGSFTVSGGVGNAGTYPGLGFSTTSSNYQSLQLNNSAFALKTTSAALPILQFEFAGLASSEKFGIWTTHDTTQAPVTLDIFNGAATGVNTGGQTLATLSFATPGIVSIGGDPAKVNVGNWAVAIEPGFFGFYIEVNNTKYYTDDLLNGGTARALVYHDLPGQPTGGVNQWAFAFEDGTDFDYNDMVVTIESITPVPEPASMFLLGSGLIGAASFLRRRSAARK